MSSRDYFDQSELSRISFSDINRRQRRTKARGTMRASEDPKERYAVALAEMGFGITEVSTRAHIPRDVASVLVVGE